MFRKSQRFYDAIYSFKDYPAEVETLRGIIAERQPGAESLLDVACGTGKHLELLREHFAVSGVDLDPEMLRLARERLGAEITLQLGDMADFDSAGRSMSSSACSARSPTPGQRSGSVGRWRTWHATPRRTGW